MSKKKQEHKLFETKYTLIDPKPLGDGGNGDVYKCHSIDDASSVVALKYLRNQSSEKKIRFTNEIQIMKENAPLIEGIIPILDSSKTEYWYTMPIVTSVLEDIKENKRSIKEIIIGVIQLTETLSYLHAKGVSHRDIKPANIHVYNDRYALGDFGLVGFPDNIDDLTKSDKGLGAIFTIAPEMKRDPKNADGKKADVFSLAKTLWMFLSLDDRGFDGVYNFLDKTHSLRLNKKYRDVHIVEIEELLEKATQNNPEDRPNIDEFKSELKNWVIISEDEHLSQKSNWNFLKKYIFRGGEADNMSWSKPNNIVDILNIVGTIPAFNHMFFSDGGGMDFVSATEANEEGCIYIKDDMSCHIVKPQKLHFENFDDTRWNYFLLEFDKLNPILNKENKDISDEMLIEDYPGNYVCANDWHNGVYDYNSGKLLPIGAKLVDRWLKGKLLITLKQGPYNKIGAAYDGRHGDCIHSEFREWIEYIIKQVDIAIQKGYSEEAVLYSDMVSINPFKKTPIPVSVTSESMKESPKMYIQENYLKWDFSLILNKYKDQKPQNTKFYFRVEGIEGKLSSFFFSEDALYLSKSGYIKKTNYKSDDVFCVYSREDAIKVVEDVNKGIKDLCKGYNVTNPFLFNCNVSIRIEKKGEPTHLFTKEEIKELMAKADDRVNNKLVIDENGYAQIIQNLCYSSTYPVRYETWSAGNKYVGKYSNLLDLDQCYVFMLEGWLDYLETGRSFYKDYCSERDEHKLIEKIKKYY